MSVTPPKATAIGVAPPPREAGEAPRDTGPHVRTLTRTGSPKKICVTSTADRRRGLVLPVWVDGDTELHTERLPPRRGLRWGKCGNHLKIASVNCLGE